MAVMKLEKKLVNSKKTTRKMVKKVIIEREDDDFDDGQLDLQIYVCECG